MVAPGFPTVAKGLAWRVVPATMSGPSVVFPKVESSPPTGDEPAPIDCGHRRPPASSVLCAQECSAVAHPRAEPKGLEVTGIDLIDTILTLTAISTQRNPCCPLCGTPASQVHSHYIGVTTFFPPRIPAKAPERSGRGLSSNVALVLEDGGSGVLTYFCSTPGPEVASKHWAF